MSEAPAAAPTGTRTHRLSFPQLGREVSAAEDESLFRAARRHGVRIVGACGGRGTCGSCTVRVVEGTVQLLDGGPADVVDARDPWVRACRIAARADCTVEVAARSLAAVVRAEPEPPHHEPVGAPPRQVTHDAARDACGEPWSQSPAVQAHDLTLPPATLADPLGDVDRIARALAQPVLQVDLAAARALPDRLRQPPTGLPWQLRAWRRGDELIGFGPHGGRTLGLAVDLGTTNAAGFLVDLDSGAHLASLGLENPQAAWGADLISRINHAARDAAAAEELRRAALRAIEALAHDLCHGVGCTPNQILDVAVCGNTAMHHLLLGLPVRQLGRAPFVGVVRDATDLKARDMGLAVVAPGAWVHLAPNVGGFVGGDHVAALLASQPHCAPCTTALVMDIGTNTEISVLHAGRIVTASAPSGPALEGGHIGCGMRAAEGAIERVRIECGRLVADTIGGKPAVGLCGSGVLDALATFKRAGLVQGQGRLSAVHPDVVRAPDGTRAVQLAPGVLFTQADVRAVQLAKAAIRTATELLLEEAGVAAASIECFVIAGAFGAYIDIASGIEIGLFPPLQRERFVQVGNAAGAGVRRLLTSTAERARAVELARQCRPIELSSRSDFQKVFLRHIDLTHTT